MPVSCGQGWAFKVIECRVLGESLENKMKKFIASAAITAALAVSTPASAQTATNIDAILADIALQCGATATLANCNTVLANYFAIGGLSAADISRVTATAIASLKDSAGSDGAVSTEIDQIIGSATAALTSSGASQSAVNSAVSNITVAVLEVVEERDLQDDAGAASNVVNALEELADTSTDNSQANAIDDIASIIEVGGSIVDVIEEIEIVNSYASPA